VQRCQYREQPLRQQPSDEVSAYCRGEATCRQTWPRGCVSLPCNHAATVPTSAGLLVTGTLGVVRIHSMALFLMVRRSVRLSRCA
jgi:hypothetical protein